MPKKPLLIFAIITAFITASCDCLFALAPKVSLDPGLVSLAYKHIGYLARAVNDDELLILGEIYKANDLVRENIKHIEPATVDDVTRIVDLFSRIREQDSWGFDPGNRETEEKSFQDMINSSSSMILVYRLNALTQGYINLAYAVKGNVLDVEIKEIVVDKNIEGKQIAKSLYFYALQQIEAKFQTKVTEYYIHGESANEKIKGDAGLATKTGFRRNNLGFQVSLSKQITFSPFTAIRVLQSI